MRDFKVYQASGCLTKLVTDASDVRKEYEDISGSLVQFDTPISAPLASLLVDINPVQDLHGQDSPYPAGGGANKLPSFTVADFENAQNYGLSSYVSLPFKAGTWTVSTDAPTGYIWAGKGISSEYQRVYSGHPLTITFDSDAVIYFGIATNEKSSALAYHTQIEAGSTATSWSPYSNICPITGWTGCEVWVKDEYDASLPATASVTFPDTVYGGGHEFVSGSGESKMAKIVLDGTQSIQVAGWLSKPNSAAWIYDYNVTKHKYPSASDVAPNIICESLPTLPYAQIQQDNIGVSCFGGTGFGMVIRINDPTLTTKALINAYLAQNPITVVYELATPVEYQITPEEINTLIGVNNIWADTGDVSVKYRTH